MSIALDFSDMFRQAPEKKPATSIPDNTLPRDVSVESENIPPSAEANDVSSWVKSTLGSLNFVVKDEDLNPSSVSMWQRVLTERLHWQNQCQAVMEENISLRRKFDSLDREKTALKTQVETLSQVNFTILCQLYQRHDAAIHTFLHKNHRILVVCRTKWLRCKRTSANSGANGLPKRTNWKVAAFNCKV